MNSVASELRDLSRRIGVSTVSTVESIRRVRKDLDLSYVELTAPITESLGNVKLILDSCSIDPWQMHAPSSPAHDIANFDKSARRTSIREHKKALKQAAFLGVRYYVIHPGGLIYGKWDQKRQLGWMSREKRFRDRVRRLNISSLTELANFAGKLGVKVALENGSGLDIPYSEVLSIVTEARLENLGICVDTGHANIFAKMKPAQVIREVGQLTWALHLNDNLGKGDLHLPPGKGNIDWSEVLWVLEEISYQGCLNLELSRDFEDPNARSDAKSGILLLQNLVRG